MIRCNAEGSPIEPVGTLPDELAENCAGTAELYKKIGYVEPWVGYIGVAGGVPVCGGAFVGAPKNGRVEIAYYTLAEHQGNGHASAMAAELLRIARATDPTVIPIAFTLPETNASTRILERLGFKQKGEAQDPDAGTVWEWWWSV